MEHPQSQSAFRCCRAFLYRLFATLKLFILLAVQFQVLKFVNVFGCSDFWGRHGRRAAKEAATLSGASEWENTERELRKRRFLEEYREEYGYPDGPLSIDELRATEFTRLNGTVYLDHAGSTLYSNSQINAILADLSATLYGNPHSQSSSSRKSSDAVATARQEVLNFFNAPAGEYRCIFTSGATAALKLVGETFPWSSNSNYLYTMENHNSVLGIREYALAKGATVAAVDVEQFVYGAFCDNSSGQPRIFNLRTPQKRKLETVNDEEDGSVYNLFSFPLECNFSGEKFDLEMVKWVQDGKHVNDLRGRWMVLLDAAKGCGTSPLDLSRYSVDFVTISFYKIFGYPTGLGALLVRNDVVEILRKRYFGGGTVAVSIADRDFMQRRGSVEQWLEDGTVSFLNIASLPHGFAAVRQLGVSAIGKHAGSLTRFTASMLASLRHSNGCHVCTVYGKHNSSLQCVNYWGAKCEQGPVVAFNLKHSDGSWIGHREVEKLAVLSGIHLRTGCFCNPGACSKHLRLSHTDFQMNYEVGHVCWDDNDIIAGKPTGAVRVSFGYMSTIEDALVLIDFIYKFFVDSSAHPGNTVFPVQEASASCELITEENAQSDKEGNSKMYLESITIYPVKSCGGFSLDAWPIGDCGLMYDHEWLILSNSDGILTQKKCPMMCLIGTFIDLSAKKLLITFPNMRQTLDIPLEGGLQFQLDDGFQLCGNRINGQCYGLEVSEWFTRALGTPCNLIRRKPRSRKVLSRTPGHPQTCLNLMEKELSFANEGQYLLISRASVEELNQRLISQKSRIQVDAMRFRPNLVVSGALPYEEDQWQILFIGNKKFSVLGGCNRCHMVNIDQSTGNMQESNHPLLTLASYRRFQGRILFGILLVHETANSLIDDKLSTRLLKVGNPVICVKGNEPF